MSTHDIKGLLRRLDGSARPSKPHSGVLEPSKRSAPPRALQAPPALTDEQKRFKVFWEALERAIPEPPEGWEKRALPPGSTPRTSGRPSDHPQGPERA